MVQVQVTVRWGTSHTRVTVNRRLFSHFTDYGYTAMSLILDRGRLY